MRLIFFIIFIAFWAACQSDTNKPSPLTKEQLDSLEQAELLQSLPNSADSLNVINPAIWSAAEVYGINVCNCGKKFFPLYEEKEKSFNNDMTDEEKGKIEDSYMDRLSLLRDTFRECRAEALAKFQEISNYDDNLLNFRQGDSLQMFILKGFNDAGCDEFELAKAKIFSEQTQRKKRY